MRCDSEINLYTVIVGLSDNGTMLKSHWKSDFLKPYIRTAFVKYVDFDNLRAIERNMI